MLTAESRNCDFRHARSSPCHARKSHLRLSYCECVSLARQFQPSHCYFFNAKRNDAGQCNSPRVLSPTTGRPLLCIRHVASLNSLRLPISLLSIRSGALRWRATPPPAAPFCWVRATHGASWTARLARQGASTQRLRDPVPPGLRRGFQTQGAAKPTPGRRHYRLAEGMCEAGIQDRQGSARASE